MNRHCYRLIRNRRTALWIPVPEIARSRGKGKARAALSLLSMAFSSLAAAAGALPVPCGPGACGSNPSVPGFVSQGAAAYATSGNRGVVSQVGNKAILNWQNFNIGRGNTVTFQQVQDLVAKNPVAGANFSTLNRIWQADPSVIAGAINVAGGQKGNLTFINQNGIVFTGTAQVDVNTLTASSLNMPDKFFMGALTPFGNAEAQFEGSGGFVSVLEGARISAANGGRVMLLAPTVNNRGRIETQDGQTILAAGTKVYLSASQDPNLRGFLVEVDSPAGLTGFNTPNSAVPAVVTLDGETHAVADGYSNLGNASNTGTVQVGTGNATMVGYAVNQMGRVSATNSVVLSGSVYLTAKDTKKNLVDSSGTTVLGFASTRAGQVRIGENSRTVVMPALDSAKVQAALNAETLSRDSLDAYLSGDANAQAFLQYMPDTTSLDSQTFNRSQVRVVGQNVQIGNGALIRSPAGDVSLYAVDDPSRLKIFDSASGGDPFETINSGDSALARIQLAPGARVDVSGLEAIQVSVARNVVEVRLQGDELKDSAVNRDGPLRGQKVWIDVARGSDLVSNVDDYKGQIGRSIAERSTDGGTINLRSQGEVVVPAGAALDVSGGYVDFTPAATKRTLLVTNGKLVDIADARSEVRYDGIASRIELTDPRWGVTRVFDIGENLFNAGYRDGKDAGGVNLVARRAVADGRIEGRTTPGLFQTSDQPAGATLTIGASLLASGARDHFLSQNVQIGETSSLAPDFGFGETLPDVLRETLTLPSSLFGSSGVNRLELYSNEGVSVDRPVRVTPSGSVRLTGEGVAVNADIEAPAGNVSLSARENVTTTPSDTVDLQIGSGVTVDVSGRWINDGLARTVSSEVRAINGGSITLTAFNDIELGASSQLNLLGGGYRNIAGKTQAGNGGNLSLDFLHLRPELPGTAFALEQHVDAAALGKGGSLSLTGQKIEIAHADPAEFGTLWLGPQFFRQGFSSYSLTGLQGIELAPGTGVAVRTASRELLPNASTAPTGTDIQNISSVSERIDELRSAASLSLRSGVYLGQTSVLELGAGSHIDVDPRSKVSLTASAKVNIFGAVSAPAGTISATLEKDVNVFPYVATDAIVVGPGAVLSAAGVARVFPDAKGLRKGDVLPAGTITLNAVTGYVVADSAAVIDVSGAKPVQLDQLNAAGGFGVSVAGDAGHINLSAREGVVFDAAVLARGGSAQTRGGTLDLAFGSKSLSTAYPSGERILNLGGASPGIPANLDTLSGTAHIDPVRLEQSGVDSISLSSLGTIRFQSDVNLGGRRQVPLGSVFLDAPQIDVNGRSVAIRASMIGLGNTDIDRQSALSAVSAGSGIFTANADFLELTGKSSWNGASSLQFGSATELRLTGIRAAGSSARPSGRLQTTADVTLTAGVVAPSSLTEFVVNTTGDMSVSGSRETIAPLSALGSVSLQARNITQGGSIHAPYGQINLEASENLALLEGSVTSVGGTPGITPFGMTVNGRSWIYDYGIGSQIISTLDEKAVRLKGQAVDLRAGARVDVSGRGDLQAWEFTPGPGGSVDVLAKPGVYAVVPGYGALTIPGDPQNASGFDQPPGTAVWLAGGAGLPGGVYTLLPAHYALLPGAYLVQVSGARKDVLPGQGGPVGDGSTVVSGYLTDARHGAGGPRDGRYSGYTVLPQSEVLKRSEFSLTSAAEFFGAATSGRPGDAGSLSINAAQALALNSDFDTTSLAGMRGAQVDITAPKIAIVSAGGAPYDGAGFLEIDVQSLNKLKASSLLIGGTRTATAEGIEIRVGTQEVVVANTELMPLTGPELLFAANDKLTVKSGSLIEGKGTAGTLALPPMIVGFNIVDSNGSGTITAADINRGDVNGDGQITALDSISGNSALLRVSGLQQAALERRNVDRTAGEISIEGAQLPAAGGRAAAILRADGSLRVDATKETLVDGDLQLATGGALAVGARRVSVGETAGVTEGLVLSNERLAALGNPSDFSIRSYTTLDLYGSAVLGNSTGGAERIRNLLIEAGGIGGHANSGKTAVVSADVITLANPDSTAFSGAPLPGDGTLRFVAQELYIGSGGIENLPFEARGFSGMSVAASQQVVGQGKAQLKTEMPLSIETARITTKAGADVRVDAGGGPLITTASGLPAPGLGVAGIGGKLTLSAPTVIHGSHVDMPSGIVKLEATGANGVEGAGSVSLTAGSSLSAAGTAVNFFDVQRHTNGGTVTLSSLNADVRVDAAATVNVSGSPATDAGALVVWAPKGVAQLDGNLLGNAVGSGGVTPRQGRFVLDVSTLPSFNQLNQELELSSVNGQVVAGGFTESRDIRVRSGNVDIGVAGESTAAVTARHFQLAADAGRIDIHGQLDAGGGNGGTVALFAGSGLTLHSDAGIAANATNPDASGGTVLLSTSTGNLNLAAGSSVNVSAGTGGRGGELHLRAPRNGSGNDIQIDAIASTVTGAEHIRAEGFKTYVSTNIATADFGTGAALFTDASTFMANTAPIETRLGVSADDRFQLQPGIEIRSTNSITDIVAQTLANDWTFHTWRYDPDSGVVAPPGQLTGGTNAAGKALVAGVLTLRSSGPLNLNGSLSDGFSSALTTATVQGLDSWTYRLVAGADIAAANPLSVKAGTSDVTLANAKLLRTGTGDIDIASSDGIRFGNLQSVVYTAGRPVAAADIAGFNIMPADATGTGASSADYNFTRDGGDIRLTAAGDVDMINTPLSNVRQLYSNWLYRQGQVDTDGNFSASFTTGIKSNPQTAWWVRFDRFQQGIGALGGGNVDVVAGGSVKNVSVSSATQGFMASSRPDADQLSVLGEGDVRVRAGGDLLGGQYWSGRGNVEIAVDGSIGSWTIPTTNVSTLRKLYPIVALGDGKAEILARENIDVHGIIDPFLVVQDIGSGRNFVNVSQSSSGSSRFSLFSGQTENTAASLSSLNGMVQIHNPESSANNANNAVGVQNAFSSLAGSANNNWNTNLYSASNDRPLALAPASLTVTAFQGDVDILNNMILRPSAAGTLELYAGRNVSIPGTVVMSDNDLGRVPSAAGVPINDTGDLPAALRNWRAHAEIMPVHQGDENPVRIYAAGGSVAGKINTVSLILPKAVDVQANGDITDLGIEAQNLREGDVTSLRAGRDISFTNQGVRARNAKISVGGPGLVDVEAGRNIDLGASEGIVTRGDLDNPALPATGAGVNVAIGVPKGVDYQGAMDRLIVALEGAAAIGAKLDEATLWQARWLAGDDQISDAATALAAVRAIDSLPDAAQRLRVRSMFFQALRDTGRDFNNPDSPYAGEYGRGYKTIELLFPGIDEGSTAGASPRYGGELNLFASRIRTERGGDIEFMAPGGQVVIGLAQLPDALAFYNPADPSNPSSTNRNPVPLGMVTVERGAIRGFTRDDVLVNQSRILTVGGGDVLLWSSNADIDAGKGKRAVTTVPPPIIKVDSSGNVSVELQGVATGSGIGALAGQPGVIAGDVDLIAPKGTVNAGEAGIRATNLNIAAQVVLNAQNIQVSGTSAGAPVSDTSSLSAGLAGNSIGDTQGQDAARALGNQSADARKTADAVRRALAEISLISVEVLGFGEQ